jgi:outer membrane scaffolding protein for murein synthesis (MipA/OmpV family)
MKKTLTLCLLLASCSLYAQEVELAKSQLNLNILPLTLSFEGKVSDNQSITLAGGLGYTAYYSSDSFAGDEAVFIAIPVVYSSFRNYYSRKFIRKDNLRPNSGNYFGLFASYQFETLGTPSNFTEVIAYRETSNVYTVGPVWGFERNYASGMHLGLSLGAGVIGGKYIETNATILGEFELGFVLFQNK